MGINYFKLFNSRPMICPGWRKMWSCKAQGQNVPLLDRYAFLSEPYFSLVPPRTKDCFLRELPGRQWHAIRKVWWVSAGNCNSFGK